MEDVYGFVDANSEVLIDEFRDFVRKPGVSTENTGIDEAVSWLVDRLKESGVADVAVFKTPRHPVVLGKAGKGAKRTLLVYGHYDVQPPGNRRDWMADPFGAEIVGDRIVGRGTCDMKNNLMASVHAVRALLQTRQKLPVNLVFLFEGEEEIGSPSLRSFVEEHKRELSQCDAVLCADGGGENKTGQAQLVYGLKGVLFVELSVKSATGVEVHSGYAGLVDNPAWRLVSALGHLKQGEKVLVPGFYDGVKEPSLADKVKYGLAKVFLKREQIEAALDMKIRETLSVSDALVKMFYKPSFNINGLCSGYVVEKGMKTIVPSKAWVRIDMRLVPGQDSRVIFEGLKKFLLGKGFADVDVEKLGDLPAYRVDPGERIARVVAGAVKKTVSKKTMAVPIAPGSGAMVWLPIVLGKPMMMAGSGASYMAHRPNEFITREQYLKGVKLFATIYNDYAA